MGRVAGRVGGPPILEGRPKTPRVKP
jgi:hypothetical protein